MNRTNVFILIAISSFLTAYLLIVNFGITDADAQKHVYFVEQSGIENGSIKLNDAAQIMKEAKASDPSSTTEGTGEIDTASTTKKTREIVTESKSELLFNQNPSLLLYIFFLTLLMAISLSLIPYLIDKTKRTLKNLKRHEVFLFALLSLGIAALTFIICSYIPHAWHAHRVLDNLEILLINNIYVTMSLIVPVLVLTATCIFGMFALSIEIERQNFTLDNKDQAIKAFQEKKKLLEEYVMILGFFVATGSIIVSSTLGKTVNDYVIGVDFDLIPKEFVYLYGLAFTATIIMIYVPVHFRLRNKGKQILSEINPEDFDNLEGWNEKNLAYMKVLGIEANQWDGLKTSIIVFSPLVTSILASII